MRATVLLRAVPDGLSPVVVEALLATLHDPAVRVGKTLVHGTWIGQGDDAFLTRPLVDGARAFVRSRGDRQALWLERVHGLPTVSALADAGVGGVTWRRDATRAAECVPYAPRARLTAIDASSVEVPTAVLGRHALSLTVVERSQSSALVGAAHAALAFVRTGRGSARGYDAHGVVAEAVAIRREVARSVSSVAAVRVSSGECLVLASRDPIALDAVAARAWAIDPFTVPHVRIAHEGGIGVGDLRDIVLVGDIPPPWLVSSARASTPRLP